MMKTILLLLAILSPISSLAASVDFICASEDPKMMLTRERFLVLQEGLYSEQKGLGDYKNMSPNTFLRIGNIVEISDGKNKIGEYKVTVSSESKTVSQVGGEACEGGHGLGGIDKVYVIKGQLTLFGKQRDLKLACIESTRWAGNCQVDGG